MQFWIYAGRTSWGYLVSHSLNFSNRRMRTRLSGGVAGVEGETLPPYADRVLAPDCYLVRADLAGLRSGLVVFFAAVFLVAVFLAAAALVATFLAAVFLLTTGASLVDLAALLVTVLAGALVALVAAFFTAVFLAGAFGAALAAGAAALAALLAAEGILARVLAMRDFISALRSSMLRVLADLRRRSRP
jgi:hypothetical protein